MGFYESAEEILACPHNFDAALAGCVNRVITGFSRGTVYLHSFLIDSRKNVFLLIATILFAELVLQVTCQVSPFHTIQSEHRVYRWRSIWANSIYPIPPSDKGPFHALRYSVKRNQSFFAS